MTNNLQNDNELEFGDNNIYTAGNFSSEEESQSKLLHLLQRQNFFSVEREVSCWYYGGQPFQERPTGRIDFILHPLKPAIDCGWRNGKVGIECKASAKKAGPVICQMLDYSRALFESEKTGALYALNAVFLWPGLTKSTGALDSVMAQNRIGTAIYRYYGNPEWECLRLKIGGVNIAQFQLAVNKFTHHKVNSGKKTGSR